MAQYHRAANSTINTVTRAYDKAVADLTVEIEAIYNTFGENGRLTPAEAKAALNEVISRGEWDALKGSLKHIKDRDIRRQVLAKLNAPAYRARITRLEALRAQAYVQSKVIADVELAASKAGYMDVINEAYYRTMFDLQKGLGVGFEFATIPNRVVKTILKRPWSGQHFSSRIWGNTDYLADKLTEILTAGVMSGAGVASMRRQLQEITGAGKYAAARLIRTETTYMANAAEMESYAEAGIDHYIYVATLDNRTSPICQKLDRKVFPTKDSVPGKNLPPMHPNCRSTTRAYLGPDTLKNVERRARNPETGETYLVPGDMTYTEWYNQYVAPRSLPKKIPLADSHLPTSLMAIPGQGVWIPQNAVITDVHVIAGKGVSTALRNAQKLADSYGGEPDEWLKVVGKVVSDQYSFDVHWVQHPTIGMLEHKVKNTKVRRDRQ